MPWEPPVRLSQQAWRSGPERSPLVQVLPVQEHWPQELRASQEPSAGRTPERLPGKRQSKDTSSSEWFSYVGPVANEVANNAGQFDRFRVILTRPSDRGLNGH